MRLARKFYSRDTVRVAKDLIGCYLVSDAGDITTVGRIVETEAYLTDDPASHSFRGQTARNTPMFGPPGHLYVYFTYGMHYCCNVVTREPGVGEAVLIRALEPMKGIDVMRRRRKTDSIHALCSGPAKLVQAMGITIASNNSDLTKRSLCVLSRDHYKRLSGRRIAVTAGKRIGISSGADLPLRFCLKGSEFLSRK